MPLIWTYYLWSVKWSGSEEVLTGQLLETGSFEQDIVLVE